MYVCPRAQSILTDCSPADPFQFFFLDAQEIAGNATDEEARAMGKHRDLYQTLLKKFDQFDVPEKEVDYDGLGVANVAPSVVPNPYLPSFRIFSYNISGSRYSAGALGDTSGTGREEDGQLTHQRHLGDYVDRERQCHGGGHPNASWRCMLNRPWHSSPHSPSRTNRLYTPLGFAQVRESFLFLPRRGFHRRVFFVVLFLIFRSSLPVSLWSVARSLAGCHCSRLLGLGGVLCVGTVLHAEPDWDGETAAEVEARVPDVCAVSLASARGFFATFSADGGDDNDDNDNDGDRGVRVSDTAEAPAAGAAGRERDDEQVCAVSDGGSDDTVVGGVGGTVGEGEEELEAATAVPGVHVHGSECRALGQWWWWCFVFFVVVAAVVVISCYCCCCSSCCLLLLLLSPFSLAPSVACVIITVPF